MSGCYCMCAVHKAFATVTCRGEAEVTAVLVGKMVHEVEMCKPCATWWEDSRTLHVLTEPQRHVDFDPAAFYRSVQAAMTTRGIASWREVARQAALTPNTLTRLKHGAHPSATTLARLMCWMGRTDLAAFIAHREAS